MRARRGCGQLDCCDQFKSHALGYTGQLIWPSVSVSGNDHSYKVRFADPRLFRRHVHFRRAGAPGLGAHDRGHGRSTGGHRSDKRRRHIGLDADAAQMPPHVVGCSASSLNATRGGEAPLRPRVRQLLPATRRNFTGAPARHRQWRWSCISKRNEQLARATFRRTPPTSASPPISTPL